MSDCDKVKEFISDYIEKRLTPGLKTELDNHFQQCPDCQLVLERIPKVQSLMSNLEQQNGNPHTNETRNQFNRKVDRLEYMGKTKKNQWDGKRRNRSI